jgi:hypothetical protein
MDDAAPSLQLVVVQDDTTTLHALKDGATFAIGRADECEVRIDDPSVSRRHALLVVGEAITVQDLGSRNGVRALGRTLSANETVPIVPGVVFEVGVALCVVQRRVTVAGEESASTSAALEATHDLASARAEDVDALAGAVPGSSAPWSARLPGGGDAALVVGSEGRWFKMAGRAPIHLLRQRAMRLILDRLVQKRLEGDGAGLSVADIFHAGWPDENIKPHSMQNRVYVALSKLRKLGLNDLLLSRDDGYLLDPLVPVLRVEEPPAPT